MKNTTVTEMKPRIGTDCRMSSSGTSSCSARRLLAAQRRVGEGEEQRQAQGREHAQRRARGVFGQMRGVERQRLLLQLGERLQQIAAGLAQERQEPEDQEDREQIPSREQARPAADGNWHDHAHVRDSESRLPLSHHLHENPRPDCASAAASFAR